LEGGKWIGEDERKEGRDLVGQMTHSFKVAPWRVKKTGK
jgi:hypothetical protein